MKYAKAFRLSVRLIGLLLMGLALPSVCSLLIGLAAKLISSASQGQMWSSGDDPYFTYFISTWAGGVLQFGFGMYLLFGGKRIINRCLQEVENSCPACRFDLRGLTAPPACPECGIALPGDIPPSSPRTMTPTESSNNR